MENKPTIWAFGEYKVNEETKELLRKSIWEDNKSRFGWSWEPEHYLREGWTNQHPKQLFLLKIKKGDWIVHINLPEWGQCTAVKVVSEYDFDEGIPITQNGQERDFRHYFEVERVVKPFERNDINVLPTVNLKPRQRYHRIYAVDDFFKSINNLKKGAVELSEDESREEYHLRKKIKEEKLLSQISSLIHGTHRSKTLERFLAKIFRKIPNVVDVDENGFGRGTDFGADLIVEMSTPLWNFDFKNTIIVQIKSFGGIFSKSEEIDNTVAQIKEGIERFDGTAGMIITTAEKSKELEKKIDDASKEIGVPIFLLDAEDLAKFVIKYAPEMIG